MTRYRPLGTLAFAIAVAIAGNVTAPVLLSDLAARQAWIATLVCAVVLTLVFVHRAACNVEVIGDGHPRFTPGQSVGWLCVPLVNIYMAHQRSLFPNPEVRCRRSSPIRNANEDVLQVLVFPAADSRN